MTFERLTEHAGGARDRHLPSKTLSLSFTARGGGAIVAGGYPYNDDLLARPADQVRARLQFPDIAFALIFPELLRLFERSDASAQLEKRRLRCRGLLSIALITASLICASMAPLLESLPEQPLRAVIAGAAALGIAGAVLGYLNRPEDWLRARLAAESLRQLHFRLLIELAPQIVSAVETGDTEPFDKLRDAALAAAEQNVLRRSAEVLNSFVEEAEVRPPVFRRPNSEAIFSTAAGQQLLSAYGELRILRQRQFAEHNLRTDRKLVSPYPRRQMTVIAVVSLLCLLLLFCLHIASAWSAAREGVHEGAHLHVFALCVAIVALAGRAVEEGLKPRAEVERYRHYLAATQRTLEQYEAGDVRAKLDAAMALERTAFDELVIFLRAHHESRFSM